MSRTRSILRAVERKSVKAQAWQPTEVRVRWIGSLPSDVYKFGASQAPASRAETRVTMPHPTRRDWSPCMDMDGRQEVIVGKATWSFLVPCSLTFNGAEFVPMDSLEFS